MVRQLHVLSGISEVWLLAMFHRVVLQYNALKEKEHVKREILNHLNAVDHRSIVEYKLRLSVPKNKTNENLINKIH